MKNFEWRRYERRGTVAEECPRVAKMWHPTANSVSPEDVRVRRKWRMASAYSECLSNERRMSGVFRKSPRARCE